MIDWKEMLEFLSKFESGININKLMTVCKTEKQWESKDISSCLRFLGKSGRIVADGFRIKVISTFIPYDKVSPELSQR